MSRDQMRHGLAAAPWHRAVACRVAAALALCLGALMPPDAVSAINLPGTPACDPTRQSCAPTVCQVNTCFASAAAKRQYELENNCFFVSDPCETLNDNQCCSTDARTGRKVVVPKAAEQLNEDFDWAEYQRQCPDRAQSRAAPNGVWAQCRVGQRHEPTDAYPVVRVEANGGARSYCIDGCSTPPAVVNALFRTGIFIVAHKDNPTGQPTSSFFEACAGHDKCYQTCTAGDQRTCDDRLLADMLQACATVPANHRTRVTTLGVEHQVNTREKCVSAANNMHNGLRAPMVGGVNAFNKRRQQYCQCCP